MNNETQDASHHDGWSGWAAKGGARAPLPRLRLLYHCDLDRVGAASIPGAVAARWLGIGRNDPIFAKHDQGTFAVADPQVSREQLRVRWIVEQQRFEVEPLPSARRPLGLVDLDRGAVTTPITAPTLLAPGACVAIGDRVLLGLETSRAAPGDDRLGLVGESDVMWALREEIRGVAQFGRAALVTGPTGAGKEMVARAIHACSPRANGPFIPVNCAALPESLVEAALFGHRKGAFTGADVEGKGVFRAADGGTLFLDELGELPITVQPKLLRVLQDGVVVPVGAAEGKAVNVRAVAATHRDLEAEVRRGTLREDLYHRMSTHVLRVPSLAERRFDVPELFVFMLSRLRAEHPALSWLWERAKEWHAAVPIGFIAELMRHPWRGNVRELENLAERTARRNIEPGPFRAPELPSPTTATLPPTATGTLPPAATGTLPPGGAPAAVGEAAESVPEGSLRAASEALGIAQKTVRKLLPADALLALAPPGAEVDTAALRASAAEGLLSTLEAHDFNQSSVAAALGTSRTTLIKLMDDLALPRATDLSAEVIVEARTRAGGDLDAAARLLRVSAVALKKRLTLLNLKGRG